MMWVEADIIKGKMYVTPFWRKFRPETICKSITIDHERVQLYRNEKYWISEYSMIDTCPFQAHDAVVKYVWNDMANEHMNILDYVLIQNRHEHLHYEPYGYVEPEEIDARMKLAIWYEWIRKTVPEIFQELAL
jgi:hypothetical protein